MLAGLRAREFTPRELIEAHYAEIGRANSAVNAFTEIYPPPEETAPGPLSGIPVTIKSSFSPDSVCARRLRGAGAHIVGRTNAPPFLMNYETDNYETGRTNNPLDLALTPGGSSGGEAAAIAACFSAGGMGSDGGGSIRWPAFCCRIAGLKPTPGRVPATGHTPEISHPGGLLGVAGPMARTVEDVRILFEIVAGHDASDPFSAPVPLRAVSLEGVRAGWIEAWPSRRVEEAAKALGAAPFRAPALDRLHELWKFFFFRVNWIFIRQLPQNVHPLGLEWLEEYRDQPPPAAQELLVNLALRDRLRAQFLDAMGEFDVLIAPVALCEAFPHGDRSEFSLDAVRPLTLANILGLPALTVPCGVQLIGRPYEEELLLAVGERLS